MFEIFILIFTFLCFRNMTDLYLRKNILLVLTMMTIFLNVSKIKKNVRFTFIILFIL